jgi:hypothetical protein
VFGEGGRGYLDGSTSLAGIQYRRARAKDDFLWFKLGAAFGSNGVYARQYDYHPSGEDTFRHIQQPRTMKLVTALAGVEVQRHFVDNHLYFLAGAELRPFYGWGTQDSSVTTSFILPGSNAYGFTSTYYPVQQSTSVAGATLGLYVGAKAYFQRYVMGMDVGLGTSAYSQRTADVSVFNFGMQTGTLRFSLGYRF